MGRRDARNPFNGTEKVIDDVSPVAEHVEDNTPTVFNAVVPRWTLGWDRIALEDPIPEFAADGNNPSEKIGVYQAFQFLDTR